MGDKGHVVVQVVVAENVDQLERELNEVLGPDDIIISVVENKTINGATIYHVVIRKSVSKLSVKKK